MLILLSERGGTYSIIYTLGTVESVTDRAPPHILSYSPAVKVQFRYRGMTYGATINNERTVLTILGLECFRRLWLCGSTRYHLIFGHRRRNISAWYFATVKIGQLCQLLCPLLSLYSHSMNASSGQPDNSAPSTF